MARRVILAVVAVAAAASARAAKAAWFRHLDGVTDGVVLGPDGRPQPGAWAVLDDGGAARAARTDAAGRYRFALDPDRRASYRLLVCPRGGAAFVERELRPHQSGPTTYQFTPLGAMPRGYYARGGWRLAVPPVCTPEAAGGVPGA